MPRPKTCREPRTIMCISVTHSTKDEYYKLLNKFRLLVCEGKIVLPWKRKGEPVTHEDFMKYILSLVAEDLKEKECQGEQPILY